MTRKLTTEEFIKRAKIVHKNKYDYSNVNYINSITKVTIMCTKHGNFTQIPKSHLKGYGCSKCKYETISKCLKYSSKDFIEKAIKVHKDKYNYSKVDYINSAIPVSIICMNHGEFKQAPSVHLGNHGCPKCKNEATGKRTRYSLQEFINKSNIKHKNKFDYSLIKEYTGNKTYYDIICPIHGVFSQRADTHLRGQNGCKRCSGRNPTTEDFINKANIVHKNKYDYTKTVYIKAYDKVIITCPKHKDFTQVAHDHLSGYGCQLCGDELKRKAYLHEPTILYLIYLEDYNVYKIGITLVRSGVRKRYAHDKGLNYKVLKEIYFLDGKYAYRTEQQILKVYRTTKKSNILKGGNTEIIYPKKDETNEIFISNINTIIKHNIRKE